MASLVSMCSSQPIFGPSRSREAYTFISYQGQGPLRGAFHAPDLKALGVGGPIASGARP